MSTVLIGLWNLIESCDYGQHLRYILSNSYFRCQHHMHVWHALCAMVLNYVFWLWKLSMCLFVALGVYWCMDNILIGQKLPEEQYKITRYFLAHAFHIDAYVWADTGWTFGNWLHFCTRLSAGHHGSADTIGNHVVLISTGPKRLLFHGKYMLGQMICFGSEFTNRCKCGQGLNDELHTHHWKSQHVFLMHQFIITLKGHVMPW